MKKKIIFLFALLLSIASPSLRADDITFKASAPATVVLGDQFKVSYTVTNARGTEFRAPDLSEFNVAYGPTTHIGSYSENINGQYRSVSTQTFTYVLTAKEEGTVNLAPATIKIKNANYSSNSLVIKVLPQGQAPSTNQPQSGSGGNTNSASPSSVSNDAAFMQILVSNRNVYEQEGFLVTFKLYTLHDLALKNQKYPEFEGFFVQDIELNPQWTLEHYNGQNYRVATIKQSVLYPQRSGKITIGAGKHDAVIRVVSQRRVRSIFDDPFNYHDIQKELTTPAVTIDVKPLPPGKPASFSGAVGNYTMKSTISSNNVKTNEAITVKVVFNGNGNIRLLKNPDVIFPNDFEVYDPKIDNNIKTTTSGSSGTKTIEYMAIPRYAGDFEIPAIQFSYFDPKTETYKTLSSESYKLHVERGAGGEGTSPAVVSNLSHQESVKYLGQDIRYIKTYKPHFISNQEIFFGSFTYILAYLTITTLFIVFFIIYRKQVKENANLALVRTKKANKIAVKRLKKAEKLLKENKKEEFYDEVLRAVWGYLSDKLNILQADLTKDNVEAELSKYGVEEALSHEYMEILNTCEFARYAPIQASDAMDVLFKQTVNAIGKMENTIKK